MSKMLQASNSFEDDIHRVILTTEEMKNSNLVRFWPKDLGIQ